MVKDIEEVDIPVQETAPVQEQQRPVLFGQSESVKMPEVYRRTREALGPPPEVGEVKKPSFGKYLANALMSTLAYGNPIWGIMGTKQEYDQQKKAMAGEPVRRYERAEDQFLKLYGKELEQDFEDKQTTKKIAPQWGRIQLSKDEIKKNPKYYQTRFFDLEKKSLIFDDDKNPTLTPEEQAELKSLQKNKDVLFQPNQAYIVPSQQKQ